MEVTSSSVYYINITPNVQDVVLDSHQSAVLATVGNIERYYMWVILLIGFPGNLLCIATIMKMSRWKSSTFYVAALATVDIVCLVLKSTYMELKHKDSLFSATGCSTINFFGLTMAALSNWLLVAMATERYLAVKIPLKVGSIWTLRRAVILTGVMFFALCLLHSHLFWTVTSAPLGCAYDPSYANFTSHAWFWISASVYAFVPCTILAIFNFLIIMLIQRSSKLRRRLTFERVNSSSKCKRSSFVGYDNHITMMLVSVTVVFVILTIPRCAVLLVIVGDPPITSDDVVRMNMFDVITSILADSNHAINFFLYFIAARQFRNHFVNLLLRRRRNSACYYSQYYVRSSSLKCDKTTVS